MMTKQQIDETVDSITQQADNFVKEKIGEETDYDKIYGILKDVLDTGEDLGINAMLDETCPSPEDRNQILIELAMRGVIMTTSTAMNTLFVPYLEKKFEEFVAEGLDEVVKDYLKKNPKLLEEIYASRHIR